MRGAAVVTAVALLTGCFGYNSSAKRWAYVGDTLLIAGGGGSIAADVLAKPEPCMDAGCYDPPVRGTMVAGVMLVTAGLLGIIINATRPTVKTSR